MSANNMGQHDLGSLNGGSPAPASATEPAQRRQRNRAARKREAELEVPFDPALIQWRAKQVRREKGRQYGLCLPYADSRGYRDRLNLLFTSNGWKDHLEIKTEPPKVFVTCQLTIEGLGTKSALGEDWLKNDTAGTSAQAQAFKRACSCFGLGRYLYQFEEQWLELDDELRPVNPPELPEWATPDGWRRGHRPPPRALKPVTSSASSNGQHHGQRISFAAPGGKLRNVVPQIREMEMKIGKSLYRGLLKSVARVWDPADIRQIQAQHSVLDMMKSAQRGLARYTAACRELPESVVKDILKACDVRAIEDICDMETLQQVVFSMENACRDTSHDSPKT